MGSRSNQGASLFFETIHDATSSWVFHLFLSGLIILLVFLKPPLVFSGDTDTARNYLNSIVSSLSTILALCISIILVAIQLTASNYTHRVLDFYVRLPYNGSLFTFYLATIMHSFFLMASIQDPVSSDPLPLRLRTEMSADIVLVVICFICLLMYMYAVVQLLKPDKIISLILREYRRAVYKERWPSALESVEQLCDIVKRSASVSDSVTGARCVEVMEQIAGQLPIPDGPQGQLLGLHQTVVDQWVEMVGVAVKERESALFYGVLDALQSQGRLYIDRDAWKAAELVIKAYRGLVFSHLLSEGQVFYVERVPDKLYQLASAATERGERGRLFALRTFEIARTIGESAFGCQPAGVKSLMEGFLMSNRLPGLFAGLETDESREDAITTYFELWKSFAYCTTMRDVSRWARWWLSEMREPYGSLGQVLAQLIAIHLNKQDIAKTLAYAFPTDLTQVHTQVLDRLPVGLRTGSLFDGWPMPFTSAAD